MTHRTHSLLFVFAVCVTLLAPAGPAVAATAPTPGTGCCSTFIDLFSALPGTHGAPLLIAGGSLAGGGAVVLTMGNAPENSQAWLVVGLANVSLPFKGGVLVPSADLVAPALTSPAGSILVSGTTPFGIPSGTGLHFQWWIKDPGGPVGFSASNATVGITP
jgi:hypothetical protein